MWLFLTLLCQLCIASDAPFAMVLGIAQDAGHPQAGCARTCCAIAWKDASARHRVSSLGIADPATGERWILDATPDFPDQLWSLNEKAGVSGDLPPTGILLTHAHIGHYTGLMHLGREAMGASNVKVYAMPRMTEFLTRDAPWSLLHTQKRIALQPLSTDTWTPLNARIQVRAVQVPHRDEISETVGFLVRGPKRTILYLPDIDKWSRWDTPIETLLSEVDAAWVDGTFFTADELPGRNMAEIPHPFIAESMERFSALNRKTRSRIRFIHLNHTNPALSPTSEAAAAIQAAGMSVAFLGEVQGL